MEEIERVRQQLTEAVVEAKRRGFELRQLVCLRRNNTGKADCCCVLGSLLIDWLPPGGAWSYQQFIDECARVLKLGTRETSNIASGFDFPYVAPEVEREAKWFALGQEFARRECGVPSTQTVEYI